MYRVQYKWLLTYLFLFIFAVISFSVHAQSDTLPETESYELVDVPFGDGYVTSVPTGWIVFKLGDHTSEEAVDVYTEIVQGLNPTIHINPQQVASTELAAFRPELVDGAIIHLRVSLLPLDAVVEQTGISQENLENLAEASGLSVAQVIADDLLSEYSWESAEVNGRPVAIGLAPNFPIMNYGALYVIPEKNTVALISMPLPFEDYYQPMEPFIHPMVMTLRLEGEPVDLDAWTAYTADWPNPPDLATHVIPPSTQTQAEEATPETEPSESEATEAPATNTTIPAADLMSVCPDGVSEIAFVVSDTPAEIYLINADGTNLRQLTDNDINDTNVSWSPDGSRLVFASQPRGSNVQVWVMNADGTDAQPLTTGERGEYQPNWSPDGSTIVYIANFFGQDDILVMNADGSNQRDLLAGNPDDEWPTWSPDGSQIAFVRRMGFTNNTVNTDIFVMNADGSNVRQLTNEPGRDSLPVWSPDGQTIAFTSERSGNSQIYLMNADGSNVRNISNNDADEGLSSFSPDGRFLAFFSNRNSENARVFDAYIMTVDGTQLFQLTDSPEFDEDISWRPCAGGAAQPSSDTTDDSSATPEAACTVSAASNANLRSGPGTSYELQGQFSGGTSQSATGQVTGADGFVWWQLESGSWVRSDVVNESGSCDTLPVVTAP